MLFAASLLVFSIQSSNEIHFRAAKPILSYPKGSITHGTEVNPGQKKPFIYIFRRQQVRLTRHKTTK